MTAVEEPNSATTETGSRTALVLGAGGVLGACWSIGALRSLETCGQWSPRTGDLIVGTSAGAVLGALLAHGIRAEDLEAGQRGQMDEGPLAESGFDCAKPMALRGPWGLPGIGSPRLLAQCLVHPVDSSLMHWCAALAPHGRGSLERLRSLLAHTTEAGRPRARVQVVATDYDSGERALFDPAAETDTSLTEEVAASCSVPGLFPPVSIGGRRYVDGAIGSSTNADLLSTEEIDQAIVVAPMAAHSLDRPFSPLTRAERLVRRLVNGGLSDEIRLLREDGVTTTVFAPTAEDLAGIGTNLLNCSRRTSVLDTALRTTARQLENGTADSLLPTDRAPVEDQRAD